MDKPFQLLRWFSLVSLACVVLASLAIGAVLARFLTETMLHRDAVVSMEAIESFVRAEKPWTYFTGEDRPDGVVIEFFNHIAEMSDVVRANAYAVDGTVLWSSTASLIGSRPGPNDELAQALAGEMIAKTGTIGDAKPEHVRFPYEAGTRFVETYIPVHDESGERIIGAIELYRLPRALDASLRRGLLLVWTSMAIGGLFLYAALFSIVRHADGTIRRQQRKLVDAETMAAIGEMASAIAHSVRNPLASIRSSAELALHEDLAGGRRCAGDIVDEADRLNRLIRSLLVFARSDEAELETVDLTALMQEVVGGFRATMARQQVALVADVGTAIPLVQGNEGLLGQVFSSLIANALEAMPAGGQLRVVIRSEPERKGVLIEIADTGPGLPHRVAENPFRPFLTTKRGGLGLGLALSRRIVERLGGAIGLTSAQGRGTTVSVRLPRRR